jgi:hypothetical protein
MLAVVLIAGIAIALAAKVSQWIRRSSEEPMSEAGSGDKPGEPDRGPDGMKM